MNDDNQPVTKDELKSILKDTLEEAFANFSRDILAPIFGDIFKKFDTMDQKFNAIDQRFDTMDQKLSGVSQETAMNSRDIQALSALVRDDLLSLNGKVLRIESRVDALEENSSH